MREAFALQIFVQTMKEAFALQKLFKFFFNKNIGIFQILTFEILTKRYLTTSIVLNNRAQGFTEFSWVVLKILFCLRKHKRKSVANEASYDSCEFVVFVSFVFFFSF